MKRHNHNSSVFYNIKYLVIDVDGTMTDGGIYYDENGNETKKFCTRDAAGFLAAHVVGIKILVLTGRECVAVNRRMSELNVDYLQQNIIDKAEYLKKFMKKHEITKEEIGYIGDDLNDLSSMTLVNFKGCPKDSCQEIIATADYVSNLEGGKGVVRDVISFLLKSRGQWADVVNYFAGVGD